MADNINTNTMVGKVIAVLIALLFVTVLAFPIANSLSNMGKDDDDGPITYTNTGDYYYTVPDDSEHTLTVDMQFISEVSISGSVSTDSQVVTTFEIDATDPSTAQPFPLAVATISGMPCMLVCMDGLMWHSLTSSYTNYVVSSEQTEDRAKFVLPITGNTISWITGIVEGETSGTLDYFIVPSGSGDYVLSDTPAKISAESEIYTFGSKNVNDSIEDTVWPTYIMGKSNANDLFRNGVMDVRVVSTADRSLNSATATAQITADNDVLTVSKIESDMELERDDYTLTDVIPSKILVPTTVTVEEEGGGSDSGSDGLGNVASTLVKLVPILLIVGILLIFVIPMINKPN